MTTSHIDDARLVALGLGERPSPIEAQHLASCALCGASADTDARLWAQLRALPLPTPPRDFSTAALARFRSARAVRHRPRDVLFGGLMVLALVAVLCIWALQMLPGALIALALSVPRWPDLVSAGSSWSRLFGAAVPVLALSAAVLLIGVTALLRRLTTIAAK